LLGLAPDPRRRPHGDRGKPLPDNSRQHFLNSARLAIILNSLPDIDIVDLTEIRRWAKEHDQGWPILFYAAGILLSIESAFPSQSVISGVLMFSHAAKDKVKLLLDHYSQGVATPTPRMPPAPAALPQTTAKTLLNSIVAHLRTIPSHLTGDDSPLADSWEDIKEQIQDKGGLSSNCWPFYLMSIRGVIEGTVDELSGTALLAISHELRVPSGNKGKIAEALLRRLFAEARKEKVKYAPFDFEYFRYSIAGMCVYAQIIARTGMSTCRVLAYSAAAPYGEQGEINTNIIQSILTADDFEKARRLNWPDQWR